MAAAIVVACSNLKRRRRPHIHIHITPRLQAATIRVVPAFLPVDFLPVLRVGKLSLGGSFVAGSRQKWRQPSHLYCSSYSCAARWDNARIRVGMSLTLTATTAALEVSSTNATWALTATIVALVPSLQPGAAYACRCGLTMGPSSTTSAAPPTLAVFSLAVVGFASSRTPRARALTGAIVHGLHPHHRSRRRYRSPRRSPRRRPHRRHRHFHPCHPCRPVHRRSRPAVQRASSSASSSA